MLILSQNRKEVVNFNEVVNIWIAYDETESKYSLDATGCTGSTLGYYETEERAKEVLDEICTAYVNMKLLEAPSFRPIVAISGKDMESSIVYRMPEK